MSQSDCFNYVNPERYNVRGSASVSLQLHMHVSCKCLGVPEILHECVTYITGDHWPNPYR